MRDCFTLADGTVVEEAIEEDLVLKLPTPGIQTHRWEEWFFTAIDVRFPEGPVDEDAMLEIFISHKLELRVRACRIVRRGPFEEPYKMPRILHIGGTERAEVRGPADVLVTLYGFHRKPVP